MEGVEFFPLFNKPGMCSVQGSYDMKYMALNFQGSQYFQGFVTCDS